MNQHKDVSRRVAPSPPRPLAHSHAGSAAHPIMFWVLTGLALAVFTPCVLVPIWIEVDQSADYERQMVDAVAGLETQSQRNDQRIQALLADPLVNERIARRELNYMPVSEQVTRWSAEELANVHTPIPDGVLVTDVAPIEQPPNWAKSLVRWLPAWPWRQMFAERANRSLLLLMSAGLLATAFLLYDRKPSPLIPE